MAGILIRHVAVITLDEGGRVLHDADVAIAGEFIAGVGAAPADFAPDEVIDARGYILMPAFCNAHTHSALSLLRGYGADLPLDRWLNEHIWPLESALTGDDVYWGAALAAVEMIRSGTAAFADHYFHMERVAQVVTESGLRASLAWCAFGGPEGEIGADLPAIARFAEEWQGAAGGRIRTLLGPHSPYACSPMFLARTAAVATRLGVGIHIHVAESADQDALSRAAHGVSPIKLLDQNGVFDVPVLAVHAATLSEADVEILAVRQATVVQCPSAYMRAGMPLAPVPRLLEAGVRVALGTESAALGGRLDMLREARQALLVHRHTNGNTTALPGDQALRLATQAGAQALGFYPSGEIAPGRYADLILLDGQAAHLLPQHDPVATILHAADGSDVTDLLVAGRWLMRGRTLLTLDEERILHEAGRRGLALASAPVPAVLSRGPV
jgi:5-methylthioadenosine/S-adenosylhomocysteine deaminase